MNTQLIASPVTMQAARAYGSSAVTMAVSIALDLSTLGDIKGFEFSLYNESIVNETGLALKTIQNTVTTSKKLIESFQPKLKEYSAHGLNDTTLTSAVTWVLSDLAQAGYKLSLPELNARLDGKMSPAAAAAARRRDDAAKMTLAANTPETPQATEAAAAADTIEPMADPVPVPEPLTMGDLISMADPVPVPEPLTFPTLDLSPLEETEAPTFSVLTLDLISCTISDSASSDDILSMVEALTTLAIERATLEQEQAAKLAHLLAA